MARRQSTISGTFGLGSRRRKRKVRTPHKKGSLSKSQRSAATKAANGVVKVLSKARREARKFNLGNL